MKYPKPLRKGDTIGVCAPSGGVPSGGVPSNLTARLENARGNIEALGYKYMETPSVRGGFKCVSAGAETRAAEFMSLYENSEVSAIIPPWGGEFLMDMLPLLDFERLKTLTPKWVCGYSDITTLTFVLTVLCGVSTIHGSNFMNMGYKRIHEYDMFAFEAMSSNEITQKSSPLWGGFTGFDDISAEPYALEHESKWKLLSGVSGAEFEGRMIGGCLDVLCKLLGTRFAPVGSFLEEYKHDGFIWTIESCEMNAADIYRTLWQMRECGWFRYCRGVVFGRPDGYSDTKDFTLTDALELSFKGMDVPIVYDADIGHIPPQIQIINGAYGKVSYDSGRAVVYQSKKV